MKRPVRLNCIPLQQVSRVVNSASRPIRVIFESDPQSLSCTKFKHPERNFRLFDLIEGQCDRATPVMGRASITSKSELQIGL